MLGSAKTNYLVLNLGLSYKELLSVQQNYRISLKLFLNLAKDKGWQMNKLRGDGGTQYQRNNGQIFVVDQEDSYVRIFFPSTPTTLLFVYFQFSWQSGEFFSRLQLNQRINHRSPLVWFDFLKDCLENR